MKRFENKSVVITGGAGGIGKATAQSFAPEDAKAAKESFEKSIPLGRYATNDEIAVASDESSFITGTINPIDGGMTA